MIRVAFHRIAPSYPQKPPFDAPEAYPELAACSAARPTDTENYVYPAIRDLLRRIGLDTAQAGTPRWNPLGDLVHAGGTVLLKPNLVTHIHQGGNKALAAMVTHPAVLRPLLDYARLAVGEQGKVLIADTPIENCDFQALCDGCGLHATVHELRRRGFANLELIDLRTYQTVAYPDSTFDRRPLQGDPRGYSEIDLGERSAFAPLERDAGPQNYYTLGDHSVDHIDPRERRSGQPNEHHRPGLHRYRIGNTILSADCVISVAKLKTHKFAGVTLNLKNAIGICEGKEHMPHRRPGTPAEGGDSFAAYPTAGYVLRLKLKRQLAALVGRDLTRFLRRAYRHFLPAPLPHEIHSEPLFGDWHGNDTIWRTTLDLATILHYADASGLDLRQPRRSYLAVVDGVIGMDHEAPMAGLPVASGLLLVGRDPVATDLLATYLMGFDPRRIPTLVHAVRTDLTELGGALRLDEVAGDLDLELVRSHFVPTKGWVDRLLQPVKEHWAIQLGLGQ